MSPDRGLALAGAENVRDLGGLPLEGGGTTVRGRLFRGELLPSLIAPDLEILRDRVGLRTVVDLRSRSEVRGQPGTWVENGMAWIHCPFNLRGHAAIPESSADWVAVYMSYLESSPPPIVLAANTLMAPSMYPALFHCAAGKDRTGVLSALLLDVLGVRRQAIGADYARTGEVITTVIGRLKKIEPYGRMLAGIDPSNYDPRAATIVAFLEQLDARHGGAEAWLLEHGVAAETIASFRRALVTN
jgi:protein-tyrosine phosphatase